jgi:hypothetical protein
MRSRMSRGKAATPAELNAKVIDEFRANFDRVGWKRA